MIEQSHKCKSMDQYTLREIDLTPSKPESDTEPRSRILIIPEERVRSGNEVTAINSIIKT